MIENNLTWLYDDKGEGPIHPDLLPKSIGDILNDPYRTLARWLRDCGCYSKDELKDKDKPMGDQQSFFPDKHHRSFFIEFRWANFLRQNIQLTQDKKDFSTTCATMPYCSLYLTNEVKALLAAFEEIVQLIGCHALREVTYDQYGCLERKSS